MTAGAVQHDAVIVAAAISGGIHAALIGDHFDDGVAAGGGFLGATLLLAALIVVLTWRPQSVTALRGAALVLTGLMVSYAFAVTTGLPVLHPDAEPVDGLALATKAVEAIGLVNALQLLKPWRTFTPTFPRLKGTLS